MLRKSYIANSIVVLVVGMIAGATLSRVVFTAAIPKLPFENLHLIFFAGGSPEDPFARIVYRGAQEAAAHLGPRVTYVWSKWNQDTMVSQFIDAITVRPDGIAIMGHPGEEKLGPLIDEAMHKGISVTSLNVPLVKSKKRYAQQGFGYAGAHLYSAGETLAEKAVSMLVIPKGSKALVLGVKNYPVRGARTLGMLDALASLGINVDYMELNPNMREDPLTHLTPEIRAYLEKNSIPPQLVLVDDNPGSNHVGAILRSLGVTADRTKVAGVDLSPDTLKAIDAGNLQLTLDQQPFLQGYLAILQLCLTRAYGFAGLDVDTGTAIIDQSNIAGIKTLVGQHIR